MSGEFNHETYPLPEGLPDAEVNKAQLAEAFAVSETTIDKWIRKTDFPIVEGGSNGIAYRFRLSQVWAWRQAAKHAETRRRQEESAAVQQLRMHLLNVDQADEEITILSAKDRREEYLAEAGYLAAARQRRELIPTTEVMSLLESVFGLMRDGLDSHPDRVARALGLDGAATETLVRLNDELLAQLRQRIDTAYLGERPDRLV